METTTPFAASVPTTPHSTTERRFRTELAALGLAQAPGALQTIGTDDVAALPAAARRYMYFMGVLDRPQTWSFRVGWTGRFRRGPNDDWMPCEAWQYNTRLGVARIFHMSLTMSHLLPTAVRDTYVDGHGRMLAKVFDVFRVADGQGEELDLGELVTYLNDAIFFAPAMLLGPSTVWTAIDDSSFGVSLADRGHTVTARVDLDARGAPRDFSTIDRFVADPYTKGHPMIRGRWTTPVEDWSVTDHRPHVTRGHAQWHLAGGAFEYADFSVLPESLAYDVPPGA
jgi:hypothetical protein